MLTKTNYIKRFFFSLLRNFEIYVALLITIGSLFHIEAAFILKHLFMTSNRHRATSSFIAPGVSSSFL